ncbi:hypothetical protein F485_gp139 [Aeromonas phage CC2]|uniref:Uncharacterized protein n=1 Tax=Aeromonas phage CC2 TaxID=1204516 RepID=I6XLJ0_9CAUD|nr:hypothetical protein F485_gp139 [Aeromonas phage CC2]AFN39364.1 hypothetical protein CC2_161 [Aeromonas phage CC2]
MIEAGKKYRITTPVSENHIVGIGDIIELCYVGWIGVKAIGISENSYGEQYDGILMFDVPGGYNKGEYFKLVEECLEEVE